MNVSSPLSFDIQSLKSYSQLQSVKNALDGKVTYDAASPLQLDSIIDKYTSKVPQSPIIPNEEIM
jgi:hypothetical protein